MRKRVQRTYLEHRLDSTLYAIETDGDTILKAAGPLRPCDCTRANLERWAFSSDGKLARDISIRLYMFHSYGGV